MKLSVRALPAARYKSIKLRYRSHTRNSLGILESCMFCSLRRRRRGERKIIIIRVGMGCMGCSCSVFMLRAWFIFIRQKHFYNDFISEIIHLNNNNNRVRVRSYVVSRHIAARQMYVVRPLDVFHMWIVESFRKVKRTNRFFGLRYRKHSREPGAAHSLVLQPFSIGGFHYDNVKANAGHTSRITLHVCHWVVEQNQNE